MNNLEVGSLPESFGRLTLISSLDLSGCALTSLPESFGGISSLATLYSYPNLHFTLPQFHFYVQKFKVEFVDSSPRIVWKPQLSIFTINTLFPSLISLIFILICVLFLYEFPRKLNKGASRVFWKFIKAENFVNNPIF